MAFTNCCPTTFTGFCLEDDTPIGIVMQNGAQIGWIDITTGDFTAGAPPEGTKVCDSSSSRFLTCDTDSITVCVSGTFL